MKLFGYAIVIFSIFISCRPENAHREEVILYRGLEERTHDSITMYRHMKNHNFILLFKGEEGYLLFYNNPTPPPAVPVLE